MSNMYTYIRFLNDINTHPHLCRLEARTRNDEQVQQLEFHNAQLENELRIAKR